VVERRRELGMTQEELAQRAGTSQSQIWRIESGDFNPTVKTLSKLEEVLGISLTSRPEALLTPREQLEEWRRTGLLIMSDEDFRLAIALEESSPEELRTLVRLLRNMERAENQSIHVEIEVSVRYATPEEDEREEPEPVSGFDLRTSLSFA
jgi:transcriptional regulator with XRE-family HTH domain